MVSRLDNKRSVPWYSSRSLSQNGSRGLGSMVGMVSKSKHRVSGVDRRGHVTMV